MVVGAVRGSRGKWGGGVGGAAGGDEHLIGLTVTGQGELASAAANAVAIAG